MKLFRKSNNYEGTSYVGCIEATYEQLVSIFGKPHWLYSEDRENGDGKVQAEWCFKIVGGPVFTIYDWKQYPESINNITVWHIGGHWNCARDVIEGVRKIVGARVIVRANY